MQNTPYSIYTTNRPQRIAFLVNPKKSNFQLFDKIFEYNQTKWGGRFNPIILTDGKTIEEDWWKYLQNFDPDVIKSLVPLSDKLVNQINSSLSPYVVEIPKNDYNDENSLHIEIPNEGLSIFPTSENITKVSQNLAPTQRLLVFETYRMPNELIRQFVCRNFGPYPRTELINYIFNLLPPERRKFIHIRGKEDFYSVANKPKNYEEFVYPIQICSLPNIFPETIQNESKDVFTVIIGDSPEDLVYFWNRQLQISKWKRTQINQIWFPKKLACDSKVEDVLKKLLQTLANPYGNPDEIIIFASYSLNQKKLKNISTRLLRNTNFHIKFLVLKKPEVPYFENLNSLPNVKVDKKLHRVVGNRVQITLEKPLLSEVSVNEHWFVDVCIQYHTKHNSNIIGQDFWLQFPLKNIIAHNIFKKVSRINHERVPSVLMNLDNLLLKIKVPKEEEIFRALFVQDNIPFYIADPRSKFGKSEFDNVHWSDKGQYLAGMLDLFGGLGYAANLLEKRYWRRMFEKMAGYNPEKDKKRLSTIYNKLIKNVDSSGKISLEKDENKLWLSEFVLQLVKEQSTTGKELTYNIFKEEAESELEEFNKIEGGEDIFDEECLKYELSDLIKSNVVLIGIRSRCHLCNLPTWYSINEAKKILKCRGCGFEYSIYPEEKWYYKLNTLIQTCIVHNQIPIVLILGQLLRRSRTSFLMIPSIEPYLKGRSQPPTDIDVVCIKDGKFIIGEVKKSTDNFKKKDFEIMKKIARLVKPDILMFSAFEQKKIGRIKKNIEKLENELKGHGIIVRWYELDKFIYEPSPV